MEKSGARELNRLCDDAGSAEGAAGSSIVPGEYPLVSGGSNITMPQIPSISSTDIAQGNTSSGLTGCVYGAAFSHSFMEGVNFSGVESLPAVHFDGVRLKNCDFAGTVLTKQRLQWRHNCVINCHF